MERVQLDFKQRAAGEEDHEPSPRNESSSNGNSSSGFLDDRDIAAVILALQAISGRQLTPIDEPFWKARLRKYPAWRLSRLIDEYVGPMNDKVFAFLDALQPAPAVYKALPEPDRTPREVQVAHDFEEHIKTVLNFRGTSEERRRWEMESFKELDKKYPQLSVWEKVKHEKRFQGLL